MVRFVRRHWIAAVWMLFGAVIVYAARPYWWNGIIDTRARRDLYEQLPKFPQAHEVDSNRYRIPGGDGGMSNHFGLTVTYRLLRECLFACEPLLAGFTSLGRSETSERPQLAQCGCRERHHERSVVRF
jgi:hypothetical protein